MIVNLFRRVTKLNIGLQDEAITITALGNFDIREREKN